MALNSELISPSTTPEEKERAVEHAKKQQLVADALNEALKAAKAIENDDAVEAVEKAAIAAAEEGKMIAKRTREQKLTDAEVSATEATRNARPVDHPFVQNSPTAAADPEVESIIPEQYALLKYTPREEWEWHGKALGRGKQWRPLDYNSFVQPTFGIRDGGAFLCKCRDNPARPQPIPDGDARATEDGPGRVVGESVLDHIGVTGAQPCAGAFVPVVKYQQGNDPTCVFSSVASAIHAFGDQKAAATLAAHTQTSIKHTDRMHYLDQTVGKELNGWRVVGALTGDAAASFDCLTTRSPYPACIRISGTDGSASHCITTLGDWTFDSNETHALPLCQESLDRCAGSQINGARFAGCVKVLKLAPGKKLLKILGKRKRQQEIIQSGDSHPVHPATHQTP